MAFIVMNIIQRYYRHSLSYSRIRFIIEISAASLILRIVLAFLIGLVAAVFFNTTSLPPGLSQNLPYQNYNFPFLLMAIGIIIPFFETFTQWMPIVFLKKITRNYLSIVLITGIIFALLHLSYGIFYSILILPSGLALSWSFYCKYKKSLGEAFLTTFAIHSILNMISIFFIMLPLITGD